MIWQNFYIKAKVSMLEIPLPLNEFKKRNGDGDIIEPVVYHTIPSYLATFNHTVSRFSKDGYFMKGFGFNVAGLDELRDKFSDYGLEFNKDVFIFSLPEALEELKKSEWSSDT
ncbi:MAG: hypothetical protein L3I99_02000 [Sulfurimonas sp.]|nr:hypothetical protein [Sulfurimonas sp.]